MRLEDHPTVALEGSDNIIGWFRFHARMMLSYESGHKKQPGAVYEPIRDEPYIFRLQTYVEAHDELFKRGQKVMNGAILSHSRRRRGVTAYTRALLHQKEQRLVSPPRSERSSLIILAYVNPDIPEHQSSSRSKTSHSHLKPV